MSASAFATLPTRVKVCEVGPRDGLQNERATIPSHAKIRYCDMLTASGLPLIEATSFVSPKSVPQLADAADVFTSIEKRPGVTYLVLVPNERGLERAMAAGVRSIAVFTATTETFTQRNIHMTIDESLATFGAIVKRARGDGMWVRGYISNAFECPYEGRVATEQVTHVADALAEMACDEISIGDTTGVATPNRVVELCAALQERIPVERLAMHFHDTRGTALANVIAALQCGISTFDSSAGGLGGCPFAPGAAGNLATEDLIYMLDGMGIETGVSLEGVRQASRFIAEFVGHPLASRAYAAMEAACVPAHA